MVLEPEMRHFLVAENTGVVLVNPQASVALDVGMFQLVSPG